MPDDFSMMHEGQLWAVFCQSLKSKGEDKKRRDSKGDHNSMRVLFWGDINVPYLGDTDGYMIKLYTLEKGEFGL